MPPLENLSNAGSGPQVWYVIGASGSGKSTRSDELATGLATRLRVVSTDVVRAQLRAVLARDRVPELWAESFDIPLLRGDEGVLVEDGSATVNVAGFLRQCAPVLRCVEAAVEYCLTEGWSCIVEGVHLVPGEFALPAPGVADVYAELRLVGNSSEHELLFTAREQTTGGGRAAGHYHHNLPRIRVIQTLLEQRWHQWNDVPAAHRTVHHVVPRDSVI